MKINEKQRPPALKWFHLFQEINSTKVLRKNPLRSKKKNEATILFADYSRLSCVLSCAL